MLLRHQPAKKKGKRLARASPLICVCGRKKKKGGHRQEGQALHRENCRKKEKKERCNHFSSFFNRRKTKRRKGRILK